MFKPRITISDVFAVAKALWQGELSGRSPIVSKFEEAFAKYNGVKYASAVNSGSSALFLALEALGLPKGSEVICPAWGYVAAPNAIVQAGYKPKFVDVRKEDGNIRTDFKLGKAKAILCIDTYGVPCLYDELRKYNVPIIQDAAEAIGAEYKGRKINGDIACFSFWANKTMTTGEGGMIVTNDESYYKRFHHLKDQCSSTEVKYYHDDLGYSLCMGALQASLGLSQLKKLDKIISEKKEKWFALARVFKPFNVGNEEMKTGYWVFASLDFPGDRPFFFPYNWLPIYKDKKHYPVAEYLRKNGSYTLI